ncbi:methyltransferase type 11 [Candidatus Thiomargarita nelsonii]|uniref:Methyltransferase type 11 n=1 Tax=Candidatus Thiomargarita nelsonii TaxID=1003181 RepID=A0A176RSP4_9GAMM|nr:methyltransferase type 11 [Candidatus Thiomargarita nelsonii]
MRGRIREEKSMSIRSFMMAKFYDASMRAMEEAGLASWRSELLSCTHGNVLEIGSGTGANLQYYPDSLESLVVTEPDPHMLTILRENIANHSGNIRAERFNANDLQFLDDSFDTVVSTLVLCSVDSPEDTLNEIRRVLKPGGQLVFIEHVIAKETPKLIKWQKFFQPFWIYMCGNCHLTRDTEILISNAGFCFSKIDKLRSSGGPPIVSPTIKGIAINTTDQTCESGT